MSRFQVYHKQFNFPLVPGHTSSDELLTLMANPYGRAELLMFDVGVVPVFIPAVTNRTSIGIINQSPEPLWLNFNNPAVPGECMYFPAGGIVGFDLAASVPISIRTDANPARICILQFGPTVNFHEG